MNTLHTKTASELAQYVMKKYPGINVGHPGWQEMQRLQEMLSMAERAAGKALLASYIEDNP